MLAQHLVMARSLVHLAHRAGARVRPATCLQKRLLQLNVLVTRTGGRPGGKAVDTLGEALDPPRTDQVFHDQESVTPEIGKLALDQGVQFAPRLQSVCRLPTSVGRFHFS